jgi:hypothetical protein
VIASPSISDGSERMITSPLTMRVDPVDIDSIHWDPLILRDFLTASGSRSGPS